MAAAPVKSQPLHNFSFPFLKWNTTAAGTATHDSGGVSATNSTTVTVSTEPDCENNNNVASETESARIRVTTRVGSRSSRPQRSSFASFMQEPINRPRMLGLIEVKQNDDGLTEGEEDEDDNEHEGQQKQQQEDVQSQKPWNLRPRKAAANNHEAVVALPVTCGGGREKQQRETMMKLRGSVIANEGGTDKGKENNIINHNNKNKKTKFWISLSKEEIEEDVFIMTGSRPARRPKKRPKNVQKQLDFVFPGLWLVGATVDSYRL